MDDNAKKSRLDGKSDATVAPTVHNPAAHNPAVQNPAVHKPTSTVAPPSRRSASTVAPPVRRPTSTLAPPSSTSGVGSASTIRRALALGRTGRDRSVPAAGARSVVRPSVAALAALVTLGVVAVALLRSPSGAPVSPETVGVFEIVRGSVEVLSVSSSQGSARLLSLDGGEPILAGTVIETRSASGTTAPGRPALAAASSSPPEAGRAAFQLAGGASVRLDTDTRVRVDSTSVLKLERGAVYIDADAAGAAVEVRTTLGLVRDIGTQFEVRLLGRAGDESLRVRVREGKVLLRRDEDVHEADAGVELAMTGDGALTRGTSPIYGPHWDWVLDTAPVPEIEGTPLRAFLDWVTREGGWALGFADRETEELASTIVLHGDVHDLPPKEAAAMVLKGSRLEYRLSEGDFFVGPEGFREGLR